MFPQGAFTDGDKVVTDTILGKLMNDEKLKVMARTSDPQIFLGSIFPKAFDSAAQDSYIESQETFTSLFADQNKYNTLMRVLGPFIYRNMRTESYAAGK